MAYLVYIIRQNDYSDRLEDSSITPGEWLNYAKDDPELQPAVAEVAFLNSEETTVINPEPESEITDFDWYGHPGSDADTIPLLFFHVRSIATKYPDKHTIGKMIKIAAVMKARVRGDDGEYYDETFFTNGGYPVGG